MSEEVAKSIIRCHDFQQETNQLRLSLMETFLSKKNQQLQELEKALITQIQAFEQKQQKITKICEIFKDSLFPFFESLKLFHKSIVNQYTMITNKLLKEMSEEFKICLQHKQHQLQEQSQIISQIKHQILSVKISTTETSKRTQIAKQLKRLKEPENKYRPTEVDKVLREDTNYLNICPKHKPQKKNKYTFH